MTALQYKWYNFNLQIKKQRQIRLHYFHDTVELVSNGAWVLT